MSFDPAWASHFSDPAWVAIELYARAVSPLQLVVEFPDLPYIPFGQRQPPQMASRDIGESLKRHQQVSVVQKMHVVDGYDSSGKHIDDFLQKVHWEMQDVQGFDIDTLKVVLLHDDDADRVIAELAREGVAVARMKG